MRINFVHSLRTSHMGGISLYVVASAVAVHVYCCHKEDSEVDMRVCCSASTRIAVTRHNNKPEYAYLTFKRYAIVHWQI